LRIQRLKYGNFYETIHASAHKSDLYIMDECHVFFFSLTRLIFLTSTLNLRAASQLLVSKETELGHINWVSWNKTRFLKNSRIMFAIYTDRMFIIYFSLNYLHPRHQRIDHYSSVMISVAVQTLEYLLFPSYPRFLAIYRKFSINFTNTNVIFLSIKFFFY
jgi:hypothetical protein